ncbi:MAG: T9SS C-terminal target domain-containing protein [Haliscomenobacteraceae bacterium CHB4]|nr:hypothetical protein [Saprospiraceae bacterium]MCE7924152.1 T9SS C-terminal target domain-containing protein [Haliscomenobacteraceae bacterium CHB4]
MKSIILLINCFVFTGIAFAQNAPERTPDGGGEYVTENAPCITPDERKQIEAMLAANIKQLRKDGRLHAVIDRSIVAFDWPLQAAGPLGYNSYYAINNYVDQNTGGGIQDYNCGTRSYDGHQGIDIDTWPFPWNMVANNSVEVIAAADGTIIAKQDGNNDNHCSCSGNWNAVYVQHADGSIAWYGHMKKNSLTSKSVGETVTTGEYLGVVASSGCSTQPHLHFEVYEALPYQFNNLIEPFEGSCNAMNAQSWWAAQKPYREPTLNANLTHDAVPVHGCPAGNEIPHFSNAFDAGATAYFAAYYHDQLVNHVSNLVIRKPDGTVWNSWNHTSPNTYTKSWWYWIWTLPANGPNGTWKWEVTYQGQTHIHNFTVSGAAPVELTRFEARRTGDGQVLLIWETDSEKDNDYFAIERSGNGSDFATIGKAPGKGTSQDKQQYRYTDSDPLPGINYYRLRQVDFDGKTEYSNVVNVHMEKKYFSIAPNPASGVVRILGNTEAIESVAVMDARGQILRRTGAAVPVIDLSGYPAGIYVIEITSPAGKERVKVVKK